MDAWKAPAPHLSVSVAATAHAEAIAAYDAISAAAIELYNGYTPTLTDAAKDVLKTLVEKVVDKTAQLDVVARGCSDGEAWYEKATAIEKKKGILDLTCSLCIWRT